MTAAEKLRTAAAGLADVLNEAADYHSSDCPDRVVRVLITGSRTWKDHRAIYEALDAVLAEHPGMVLVSGACKDGADAIAEQWAALRGFPEERVERHPAEWRKYRNGAGFRRNAEMVSKVAAGPGVCVAAIDLCEKPNCDKPKPHGSHGAIHCAGLAIAADISTEPFGPGAAELASLLDPEVTG